MYFNQQEGRDMTIMQHIDDVKRRCNCDLCLFRAGAYYEAYEQDAKKLVEVLNIGLTYRKSEGVIIDMAGFHFHSLDTYLPKLIRAGLRVAICDIPKVQGRKSK